MVYKKNYKILKKQIEELQIVRYLGISANYSMARAELAHAEGNIEGVMKFYTKALEAEDRLFRKRSH
ncbi:hypothetical protein [Cellulosilyticum ruminicola]|uniref:hypothetical protein n=1 Tax=Cellulosilyticum ruminicola TaxID=425254 RepID=UPI0006CFE96B|nr:hypothetical protein [Cellulosilyticum ruminicola]